MHDKYILCLTSESKKKKRFQQNLKNATASLDIEIDNALILNSVAFNYMLQRPKHKMYHDQGRG